MMQNIPEAGWGAAGVFQQIQQGRSIYLIFVNGFRGSLTCNFTGNLPERG